MYTSPIKLPKVAAGTMSDMIGCLVYKGTVYTQAECYSEAKIIDSLVGDYVGEARGTLDEWSTQSDFATEFASTYSGPVYTVNGYSKNFRLCIYAGTGDDRWLQILENLDAIGLSTGSDLFEERLHLTNNIINVTYKTHYDWNNAVGNSKELESMSLEQFNSFISELCSSKFEHIDYTTVPDFYETKIQGHLYLHMKDGTQVELRLIDGGYVGYQHLGWYFVKMDSSLFNTILNACQQ